jgi:hypothetical protein
MVDHDRYIICYPGGSGGAFLASAINSVIYHGDFKIDQDLGHCHASANNMPNFFHGDNIQSFYEELNNIQSFDFFANKVVRGHYRNIVAIKETVSAQLGYNQLEKIKFIKISVDHQNPKEILFIAKMLRQKAKSFPELSFDEFLEQTTHYVKSWYWVENSYTRSQTINLSLADIFLNQLSKKLQLSAELSAEIDQSQSEYLIVQRTLYKEVLDLLV